MCMCVYTCVCEGERVSGLPGLNIKVLEVDAVRRSVADPVWVRAEQSWTVQQLKEEIAEVREGRREGKIV